MSNDPKKPGGARDISDLKARLGLKKDGTGGRSAQGVPAPGAAKLGGAYVPPPPGVAPPPGSMPPQQQMPDARVDPFAAMRAMATQAAPAAAPEIIIVDKTVEQVEKKSKVGIIIKFLIAVLVPLVVGFLLGGINSERKHSAATISDAAVLKEELVGAGKKLTALQNTLFAAKERGPGQKSFALFDKQLLTELAAVDLGIPEGDETKFLIYKANLFHMDTKLVGDTLAFYSRLRALQDKVKQFARQANDDAQKLKPPHIEKLGAQTQFGAIIRQAPPGSDGKPKLPLVELVELGAPVCEDTKVHPEGCPGPITGFQFRPESGSPWGTKVFAKEQVSVDSVIFLGQSGILAALMTGSERFVDEVNYTARLNDIDALVDSLAKDKKDIENRMNAMANRGKPFAL